jgi:hypothetical protein
MTYHCPNCLHEQPGHDTCESCESRMAEGALCVGCATERASHDDHCLSCLANHVVDRTITIDELPVQWQQAVTDAVSAEVATREHRRIKAVELARAETLALLAMVARAPVDGAGWLRVRQAV